MVVCLSKVTGLWTPVVVATVNQGDKEVPQGNQSSQGVGHVADNVVGVEVPCGVQGVRGWCVCHKGDVTGGWVLGKGSVGWGRCHGVAEDRGRSGPRMGERGR